MRSRIEWLVGHGESCELLPYSGLHFLDILFFELPLGRRFQLQVELMDLSLLAHETAHQFDSVFACAELGARARAA